MTHPTEAEERERPDVLYFTDKWGETHEFRRDGSVACADELPETLWEGAPKGWWVFEGEIREPTHEEDPGGRYDLWWDGDPRPVTASEIAAFFDLLRTEPGGESDLPRLWYLAAEFVNTLHFGRAYCGQCEAYDEDCGCTPNVNERRAEETTRKLAQYLREEVLRPTTPVEPGLHNLDEGGFCVTCGQYPGRCEPARPLTKRAPEGFKKRSSPPVEPEGKLMWHSDDGSLWEYDDLDALDKSMNPKLVRVTLVESGTPVEEQEP